MVTILKGASKRIGLIPRLLIASLLAVVIAVWVVQAWTMRVIRETEISNVQSRLDTNLQVLKKELSHYGAAWQLTDAGELQLEGKPASAMVPVIDGICDMTHGVATIFAGDTRVATTVRTADGQRALGTKLAPGPARDAVIGHGETYRGTADILGARYLTVYEPLRDSAGRQVGILFVGIALTDVQTMLDRIFWHSIGAALIVVVLVGAVRGWMLRRSIQPLRTLAAAVRSIAEGHLNLLIPCVQRHDQLGEIGRAVELLREKALQARELEEAAAASRVAKDQQQQALERLTESFGTSVSGVLAGLGKSAEEVRGAASKMTEAAGQTRREMAVAAGEAEHSSESLAVVARAVDGFASSISAIAREVGHATGAARHAVTQARQTDSTVSDLSRAAAEIGKVVDLITMIAGQTNLLALNATVEAARAGDAGKGFAVVAGAVKQLAAQTAEATQQISARINTIQAATGKAARAVHEVVGAIDRVDSVANTISAAIEHQGEATREIAAKVQQVVAATEQASRAMHDVSGLADRSGGMSQVVLSSADQVNAISVTLREEVDYFLAAVNQR